MVEVVASRQRVVASRQRAVAGRQRAVAGLDRERILDAAVRIADAEGVDALTVRRLAADLGVHFSSLYSHVGSKEEILDGVIERLIEEAGFPEVFEDWRQWVRLFAVALRGMARAHPGAFQVLLRRPASGPVASRQAEAALAAFRRDGFSAALAHDAVRGVALAFLGLAVNECEPPVVEAPEPDMSHLTPDRFPYLFEAWPGSRDTDPMWDVVVEGLIAGLDGRARRRRQ
jgi:AcrR family transcriptional regulator